jgi:hypothetical protein
MSPAQIQMVDDASQVTQLLPDASRASKELSTGSTLQQYKPGWWGLRGADRLALDGGSWHNPQEDGENTAHDTKAA